MPMSSETRHAVKVIRDYLEGLNEAVQYELEFMTDRVTASSSEIIGGFQADNVPSDHVVTDGSPEVFQLNASPTGRRVALCH
jgi:predicted ester cyclase